MKKGLLLYGGLPILSIGLIWTLAITSSVSFPILFNLIFGLLLFAGYTYLAVIQFTEVLRPRDWLTNLRLLIFGVLLLTIITFIPSLVYQFVRLNGAESEFLRGLVNITSRISSVCILVILVAIFRYKKQDQE